MCSCQRSIEHFKTHNFHDKSIYCLGWILNTFILFTVCVCPDSATHLWLGLYLPSHLGTWYNLTWTKKFRQLRWVWHVYYEKSTRSRRAYTNSLNHTVHVLDPIWHHHHVGTAACQEQECSMRTFLLKQAGCQHANTLAHRTNTLLIALWS